MHSKHFSKKKFESLSGQYLGTGKGKNFLFMIMGIFRCPLMEGQVEISDRPFPGRGWSGVVKKWSGNTMTHTMTLYTSNGSIFNSLQNDACYVII